MSLRNLRLHVTVKLTSGHRGSKPHLSHIDKSDPKEVISIDFMDDAEKVLYKSHLHEDGTHNTIAAGWRK